MIHRKPFTNFVISELSYRLEAGASISDTFFYIAGGAIRDFLNGKPIKDFDIFYKGELPDAILNEFTAIPIANGNYPEGLTKCTHKGKWKDYDLDFIKINDESSIDEVIEAFPCSLSQVYVPCILPTRYFYTTKYKTSVDSHVILFDENCPEEYKNRIVTKYPDWNCLIDETSPPNFWNNITISATSSFLNNTFHTNKKAKAKVMKKYKIINTDKKDLYRESADENW